MKNHNIMVIGRNDCPNLCMARALASAGYIVDVLHIFHTSAFRANIRRLVQPPLEEYSSRVRSFYTCITERNDQTITDALVRLGDRKQKKLLFPTDDLCAGIIDENYDLLSSYYILPSVERTGGSLLRLMEKDRQKALAVSHGIPVAQGIKLSTDLGRFPIPEDCPMPCFLKPNISRRAGKDGQTTCFTRQELQDALDYFAGNGITEVLAETYISIKTEYSLLGVSTPDFVLIPGYFFASHLRKGVADRGTLLSPEQSGIPTELFEALLRDRQYLGLFDIDLIEDIYGNFYFVELNLRCGGSCHAVTASGVNLPAILADYLDSGAVPGCGKEICRVPASFVNEKELQNAYYQSRLSLKDLDQLAEAADIRFVYDPEDPQPYRVYRRSLAVGKLLNRPEH